MCPLKAGQAVYRARALFSLINDSMEYDDSTACSTFSSLRKKSSVNNAQKITLVGNPLNEQSHLVFEQPTGIDSRLKIYNQLNQLLTETKIPENTLNFKIPYFGNYPAVYYFKVENAKGILGSGKMVLIKR